MASVSERLRIIKEEQTQSVPSSITSTPKDNPSLTDKIIEKESEAIQAAETAQNFFRVSGIKLVFMEMYEELLNKKGQIQFENFGDYSLYGTKTSLWYEADLSLSWSKGLILPTNYSLHASIQGDLLDERIIKRRKLHRKILSLYLTTKDKYEEYDATYDNEFLDTENPTSEDLDTIRKWTEANIVNFVRQKEKAKTPIF